MQLTEVVDRARRIFHPKGHAEVHKAYPLRLCSDEAAVSKAGDSAHLIERTANCGAQG